MRTLALKKGKVSIKRLRVLTPPGWDAGPFTPGWREAMEVKQLAQGVANKRASNGNGTHYPWIMSSRP